MTFTISLYCYFVLPSRYDKVCRKQKGWREQKVRLEPKSMSGTGKYAGYASMVRNHPADTGPVIAIIEG